MLENRLKWSNSSKRDSMNILSHGNIINIYIGEDIIENEECYSIVYEVRTSMLSNDGVGAYAQQIINSCQPEGSFIGLYLPFEDMLLLQIYEEKSYELNNKISETESQLVKLLYEVLNCPGLELN